MRPVTTASTFTGSGGPARRGVAKLLRLISPSKRAASVRTAGRDVFIPLLLFLVVSSAQRQVIVNLAEYSIWPKLAHVGTWPTCGRCLARPGRSGTYCTVLLKLLQFCSQHEQAYPQPTC